MAETILSYLLAEESSNPQRISKKMGDLGSGEDGISLIPLGRDGEWEDYKTKMSWTMHPDSADGETFSLFAANTKSNWKLRA